VTIFHAIAYAFACLPDLFTYYFNRPAPFCDPAAFEHNWKEDSEGLVVILSGLYSIPSWACPYIRQIEQERSHLDVKVPMIPHFGNCNLDEASTPIIAMVRDYVQHNPGKPVSLIGVSRSGPIAAAVDLGLREENVSMRITTIAGAFFGPPAIELCKRWPINALQILDPQLVEEFSVDSNSSRRLIEHLRFDDLTHGERSYAFYASLNDYLIPTHASLPLLCKREELYLLRGWHHFTLHLGIREAVLQNIFQWFDTTSQHNLE
jgi:hypothetical protein